jgi:alkylation response protein AidB-like acyl-CoA dehydrogenase
MIFDPSESQRLLADAAARYLREAYPFAERRRLVDSGESPSRHWRAFAELGWLALPFPEELSGLGGTAADTMVLAEAFGRALVIEPYLATVLLGGRLLATLGTPAQRALVARIGAGELQLAVAWSEPDSGGDCREVATVARARDGGQVLSGRKILALNAEAADFLVVSARTSGGQRDRDGVSLFLVRRGTPGLAIRGYRTLDGFRAADVVLDEVAVGADALLGAPGAGAVALERAIEHAIAALLAEAVGCMDAAHAMTVEYAKTRVQFGRPLAELQVVRHRLADMFMALEEGRSMAWHATGALAWRDDAARARAVSAAKVAVAERGRFVGQQAIQLHGAIGLTDEYAVGHYYKRLEAIAALFGDADFHLARYGELDA